MALAFWCDGDQVHRCDFRHPGICTSDPCQGVRHSFGGRRTLKARPSFDGPPEAMDAFPLQDSMDAIKRASDWPDSVPTTRQFTLGDRSHVYDMNHCYNYRLHHDYPEPCPIEPFNCAQSGDFERGEYWVRNCGHRVEAGESMLDQYCDRVDRPVCAPNLQHVIFKGDGFTARTAFIGSTSVGAECLGIWNWVCMGDENDHDSCVGLAEKRRWSPMRVDWRGIGLAEKPRNRFSPPEIEHNIAKTVLAAVVARIPEFPIGNLDRRADDEMAFIDWWSKEWFWQGCGTAPVLAQLPGAMLRDSQRPVTAELVGFYIDAWMSLVFRREDVYQIAGAEPGIPKTDWYASIQMGLYITCEARVENRCGHPPIIDGERIVYRDGNGQWYRPPYTISWRGEATPLSEHPWPNLTEIVNRPRSGQIGANPDLSNVGICRSLRIALDGQEVHAKSVAKGRLVEPQELYAGSAKIVSIGD